MKRKQDIILQIMPNNGDWLAEFFKADDNDDVFYIEFPMWALIRQESYIPAHAGKIEDVIEPISANGLKLSISENFIGVVHKGWIDEINKKR